MPEIEEIRNRQQVRHIAAAESQYTIDIDFLLAEVDRLKAENDAMRNGPTGLGGHKCWQTVKGD